MSYKFMLKGLGTLVTKRYLGPFWFRRRWLSHTQWLSRDQLSRLQLHLLRRLLRHCYNTVPYYRRLMDERGITPDAIKTLDDINLFPVLTKRDILQAGDSLISTRYPRWLLRRAYTGGTTGTPVKIYRNLFSIGSEHAFVRRQWDWAGIGLADRCGYLTGRLIAPPDKTDGRLYVYDPVMKELILSTYHLSPATAADYAAALNRYRVKAIVGYPSAVHFLARFCRSAAISVKLQSALTSSETLTENMRNTIAAAFGCRVFDFYGSAERVCYIHTCEQGSYHVIPEYGLTELVPLSPTDSSACRVIATGFWNWAMPLVRFDMGDIVYRSDKTCSCGRAFPVIDSISGRLADTIHLPSGRELGAAVLTHLLYGTDHILESQIIQDAPDHIRIEYVPAADFSPADLTSFQTLLGEHLPGELKITLRQVKAVIRTNSGKIKPLISLIET